MRVLKTGVRLSLTILLLLLVTSFDPLRILTTFRPIPQIIFGVLLLLAFLAGPQLLVQFRKASEKIPDSLFLFSAIVTAFLVTATANVVVLDSVPHVTDSSSYLFQAKALARGWLTIPAPPVPDFFLPHFYYVDQGRMISLFQPGWPLVLALGVKLHVPWLVNPALAALSIWPLYRIINRGFGPFPARLAVLLLLISPFYIFMSASFMAHPLSGLLSLIALDHALLYSHDQRPFRILLVGGLTGALFNIRAYNSILLLLPLAVVLLPMIIKRPGKMVAMLPAVALAFGIGSIQLMVNHNLTGDALRFSQDEYFALTEEQPSCHRLGFGEDVGCKNEHGQFGFPNGFYPEDAVKVTSQRLDSLSLNLFGTPMALLLLILPCAAGRIRKEGAALVALLLSLVIGYFFFYYHGNCYGPRFYFEGIGAMVFLIALGLFRLQHWMQLLSGRISTIQRLLLAFPASLGLTLFLFGLFWLNPQLWENYKHFREVDDSLHRLVQQEEIHNAVVLIPGSTLSYMYGFNFNEPDFDQDVIFARHLYEGSAELMYLYPNRAFYRYAPYQHRLIKLQTNTENGVLFNEIEEKLAGLRFTDGTMTILRTTRYFPDNPDAAQVYFKAKGRGSTISFEQYIFQPGEYLVELSCMQGPFLGDFQLSVDGKPSAPIFSGYHPDYRFVSWRSQQSLHLNSGPVRITLKVVGKAIESKDFGIGLDFLILREVPQGLSLPVQPLVDLGYMDQGKVHPIGSGGIPIGPGKRWHL